MKILTQELKELLNYNPETGVFAQKVSTSNRVRAGDVAGGTNNIGYVAISVQGKLHLAHRLAWLFVHGYLPEHQGRQQD